MTARTYTIDSETLKALLEATGKATSTVSPLYAVVSVKVAGGRLSIAGFNGEFGIESRAAVTGDGELAAQVNAKTFLDLAGTITGPIELAVDSKTKKLQVGSGVSKSTLNIIDGEAFPPIDNAAAVPVITLTGHLLKSILRVIPFTSSEDVRPVLKGVMICLGPGTLETYAADGFTGAFVSEKIAGGPEAVKNILLPAKFLKVLLSLVGTDDEVVIKVVEDKRFIFLVANKNGKEIALTSSIVDGAFPLDGIKGLYSGMDAAHRILANVDKSVLNIAIRQVQSMGSQNMFIRANGTDLRAASPQTEIGEAQYTLGGLVTGSFKLWIRADFVGRAVDNMEKEVQMVYVGEKAPLYFVGGNFKGMVMPVAANFPEPVFGGDPTPAPLLAEPQPEPTPA